MTESLRCRRFPGSAVARGRLRGSSWRKRIEEEQGRGRKRGEGEGEGGIARSEENEERVLKIWTTEQEFHLIGLHDRARRYKLERERADANSNANAPVQIG